RYVGSVTSEEVSRGSTTRTLRSAIATSPSGIVAIALGGVGGAFIGGGTVNGDGTNAACGAPIPPAAQCQHAASTVPAASYFHGRAMRWDLVLRLVGSRALYRRATSEDIAVGIDVCTFVLAPF